MKKYELNWEILTPLFVIYSMGFKKSQEYLGGLSEDDNLHAQALHAIKGVRLLAKSINDIYGENAKFDIQELREKLIEEAVDYAKEHKIEDDISIVKENLGDLFKMCLELNYFKEVKE